MSDPSGENHHNALTSQTHQALSAANIAHGFFGRKGGISRGIYSGLNAGSGSDDDAACVAENRRRIAASLDMPAPALLSCHQYHSTDVITADALWDSAASPKADAIVTKTRGIICSALAADCAPVLFADSQNGVVGAAHAGWRGALAGVTDATIEAMESLGANRASIHAVIGPCISAPNYEVGPEFAAQFQTANAANAQFFSSGQKDRQHFDLKAYLIARLKTAGLARSYALPDCTYASPNDYFSYRYNCHKGLKDYGRNLSAICLT